MKSSRANAAAISVSTTLVALLLASPRVLAQSELYKILAPDGQVGDRLGGSVSVDGDRALIGAGDAGDSGPGSGAAYVFAISTGQLLVKLQPTDSASNDTFGDSVSISEDLAVVGANGDDDLGFHAGAVYVFDVTTGVQLHKLFASDGAASNSFGESVSLSGDLAVAGARGNVGNGNGSGAAYVFDATSGAQLLKLVPQDGKPGNNFGSGVAICGGHIVVGASQDDDNGLAAGSVYVFDTTTGAELYELFASDGNRLDGFGASVAIDGNLAVIGAPGDSHVVQGAGSAYVFDILTGQELHKLVPSPISPNAEFGLTVSISGDRAVIGARMDGENGVWSGAAILFDVTTGQLLKKYLASDGGFNDLLGSGVGVSGGRAVAGAPLNAGLGSNSGAAYVFDAMGEPGSGYCFGDPGSGTPCPCSNDNDGSVPGSGCANGVFASGARLVGTGLASVGHDSLVLSATGLEPNNHGLYFQADDALGGGDGLLFGDGLRCAGGALIRLEVRLADGAGASSTSVPIATKGAVAAGDIKRYQLWYRNPASPPCGPGVNDFNLTNGYEILWTL